MVVFEMLPEYPFHGGDELGAKLALQIYSLTYGLPWYKSRRKANLKITELKSQLKRRNDELDRKSSSSRPLPKRLM